jgi:hypothetical protein
VIERAIAFLEAATLEDLDQLPPARQRKFQQLCAHWAQVVERRLEPQTKPGILSKLKDGERSE